MIYDDIAIVSNLHADFGHGIQCERASQGFLECVVTNSIQVQVHGYSGALRETRRYLEGAIVVDAADLFVMFIKSLGFYRGDFDSSIR